jgi:hypothetical protein
MNEHAPISSDFATPEEAEAYDRWFREKVAASLADPRPPIPHAEAMRRAREAIARGAARAR